MSKNRYEHFTVIVAGDNPDELMEKYDNELEVEPYTVYKYNEAELLQKKYIQVYEELIKISSNKTSEELFILQQQLKKLKTEDPFDFYLDLTENYEYDEKTGDAISRKNPNGKWESYNIGKNLSIPFKLKNGKTEIFSAIKKDIDWNAIHLANKNTYEMAWDMVMNGKKPSNENEELIFNNMKERVAYFQSYGNKENYVINNTAFWAYAFLSEKTGWMELNEKITQFEWVTKYFDNFIKPLSDDTKLTIFECVK